MRTFLSRFLVIAALVSEGLLGCRAGFSQIVFPATPVGQTSTRCFWFFFIGEHTSSPGPVFLSHPLSPPFKVEGFNVLPMGSQPRCTGGRPVELPVNLAAGQIIGYTLTFSPTETGSFGDFLGLSGSEYIMYGSTPGAPPLKPRFVVTNDWGNLDPKFSPRDIVLTGTGRGVFTIGFEDRSFVGSLSPVTLSTSPPNDCVYTFLRASPPCRVSTTGSGGVAGIWPAGTQRGSCAVTYQASNVGCHQPLDATFSSQASLSGAGGVLARSPVVTLAIRKPIRPCCHVSEGPCIFDNCITWVINCSFCPLSVVASQASSTGPFLGWMDPEVGASPFALGPTLTRTFSAPGSHTIYGVVTEDGVTWMLPVTVDTPVPPPGCQPDGQTLCLQGGRFRVRVDWQAVHAHTTGIGKALAISSDTGSFSFFDPSNQELVVKVLDGRGLNGAFWVFYGALTNVQYELEVTDTLTGAVKTYFNPQDRQASVADTQAFPVAAADAVSATPLRTTEPLAASLGGSTTVPAWLAAPARSSPSCATVGSSLCLGGRFQVQVRWVAHGGLGMGTAVSLTPDSGYFWFFDSANVELITKIVDGTSVNGNFWFFYGALSDVTYLITVTDTQTGAERTYFNFQGTLASSADTSAFSPAGL